MIIEVRLEDQDGIYTSLELTRTNGYVPQALNTGFPSVRENNDKRSSQNGEHDFTQYFGARAVTLSVALAPELASAPSPTEQQLEDGLRAWLAPHRRSWLVWRQQGGSWRRLSVRGNQLAYSLSMISNNFGRMTCGWKCADGVSESVELITFTLSTSAAVEQGRSYDRAYDRTYPASPMIGSQEVINLGTAPAYPVLRIHGPQTGPRIENQTTGKKLQFKNAFALVAGQFLEVDFKEGTILLNNDPANSRYSELDLTVSEWWELIPGSNLLRSYPLVSSSPSIIEGSFHYQYI